MTTTTASLFDTQFANNWDHVKSYKTIETLEKKLVEMGVTTANRGILVQIPTGKNAGRFTVVFPWNTAEQGQNNNWAVFSGFKVFN